MEHHLKTTSADVLVESISRFAPRLDGKGFYCEQQPGPSQKTVRYVVKAKPAAADPQEEVILGHIGWKGFSKCYAFFPFSGAVLEHRCLAELAEILDYLSKKQRRMLAPSRRQRSCHFTQK